MDIARKPAAKPATALHQSRAHGVIDLRKQAAAHKAATTPHVEHDAHHTPAAAPSAASQARHESAYQDRLVTARQISRSPLINKFGGEVRADHVATAPTPAPTAAPTRAVAPAQAPAPAGRELPNQAITQHEALSRLMPKQPAAETPATAPAKHKANWRPHLGLSPHKGRVLTTTAAVFIMGVYIWLQNYPKLALQTASNQAGLAATLPGYLPSSYNLSKTLSQPGLVTLNFTSPSIPEILRIAQHRTGWDSSSLLDNFVAKQADDYSTVHGQGLTIYLFGQNQASWVNHGIWYNIEGASKLSREQILKIAYSL